jgi:ATP-binding cassette subfamily B protein
MTLFSFIWGFVRARPVAFAFLAVFNLIWIVEILYWPYYLSQVVEVLTLHDADRAASWPSLKVLMILGGLIWVLSEAVFRSRDLIQAWLYPKVEADIRMTMFDHVQRHSPKYFNEHFAGSLANKIGDMVLSITIILRTTLMFFIPASFISIFAIIIYARINTILASIVGIWIVLHVIMGWLLTRKCALYSNQHGEARSELTGKIVDSLTNNFVVNLFYRFAFEKKRVASYQKEELKTNHRSQGYTVMMFSSLCGLMAIEFLALNGTMFLIWMQGSISTEQVAQMFFMIWSLGMVLLTVADRAPEFFQSLGIAEQAISIMQDPQDLNDDPQATPLSVKHGEIVFENVYFRYGKKEIFQNKNLRIAPGEKVGLVGYSGAGKSTFVNLILRFFPIDKGRILIDGQDIATVTLESLRNQLALIPQDPILFHRSLEENMRFGRTDATHEEIVQAAKLAHCDEFIRKCPEGYSTLVGERGTKLSGGEKQRIAIARAMLHKAPILILDEATSALDSVTENYIQDSLEKLMAHRTTIVVAHRLSTLSKMDRILVFDQGKIIEEGSHSSLLHKKGHYAHMWKLQAGGFLPDTEG